MNPIIEKLNNALENARVNISNAKTEGEVEAVRIEMVGRQGIIPALSKQMKLVPKEEKPQTGKAFNMAKQEIQSLIKDALDKLESSDSEEGESIDLTLPGRKWKKGHKHPVSKVIDECVDIFRRMGFIVADGPEMEDEYHNFDALNTPADHPARNKQDTFYFGDGRLLRTQTSPVQIRTMENEKPPIRIIAPGRCFRRDTPDATHSMNFHQIEGLYIDKNVSLTDLKNTLLTFASEIFGSDIGIRMRPHFFPFTEPSVECDFSCIMCNGKGCRVCKNSGWIEIAGAGIVDPAVLENVGLDPKVYSGYAFGFGIERIAMLKYKISDIRYLYENDVRFLSQF